MSLEFDVVALIRKRAEMLSSVRRFFSSRNILEVDCPALSPFACVDAHIDVLATPAGYLHTSPEYRMKGLLASGSGDIYQLSHVFRAEEKGKFHRVEFMMLEWYRIGMSYQEFIEETVDFIRFILGDLSVQYISYREAMQEYAGIDYMDVSLQKLQELTGLTGWDFPSLLDYILTTYVEPHFDDSALFVLMDYPADQAALARTYYKEAEHVAKRFEIYHRGLELANGYHELSDPKEQRERFKRANIERERLGKQALPIDEHFLSALEKGLPDCCGVACGVDRLFLLQQGASSLAEIFPWEVV